MATPKAIRDEKDEEYNVNRYAICLCDGCMDAIGEECHTPGCAMWLNRAPDLSLRNNPMIEKLELANTLPPPASPGELPTIYAILRYDNVLCGARVNRGDAEYNAKFSQPLGHDYRVIAYPPPKPFDDGEVREALINFLCKNPPSLVKDAYVKRVEDYADRILAALKGAV